MATNGKNKKKAEMIQAQEEKNELWNIIFNANQLKDPLEHGKISTTMSCWKDSSNLRTCVVRHYKVRDVPGAVFDWMLDLMARNMKDIYSACSWGWNARKKKKEMSETMARYLIVFNAEEKPIAFSHFRYDMDYGRAVLYCYEVQVEKTMQSMKLGSQLVSVLEGLALSSSIPLVVLTVLRNNPLSLCFFKTLGYREDETNLTDKEVDHLILSKRVIDSPH